MVSLLALLKELEMSGIKHVIPDSIGAAVKKAIENLMLSNPSVPMYYIEDLLKNGLQEAVPSIGLYTYEEEDKKFRNASQN